MMLCLIFEKIITNLTSGNLMISIRQNKLYGSAEIKVFKYWRRILRVLVTVCNDSFHVKSAGT